MQKKDKANPPKDEPEKVEAPPLTFTEDEHLTLVKYINMVDEYADFNGMKPKTMHVFAETNLKVVKLVKKIENHILEVKRVWQANEQARKDAQAGGS